MRLYRIFGHKIKFQKKSRGRGVIENENPLLITMARREEEILELDPTRCFGCAACVSLCPVDALELEDLLVIIDEPSCTHCELCIPSCPVSALYFEKVSVIPQ